MSWHDYNESLVERGRILFDLGFAADWTRELEHMNREKRGRPYEFPAAYLFLQNSHAAKGPCIGTSPHEGKHGLWTRNLPDCCSTNDKLVEHI